MRRVVIPATRREVEHIRANAKRFWGIEFPVVEQLPQEDEMETGTKITQPYPEKKVKLTLVGVDGNAFAIMGAFTRAARREGWTKQEIDSVIRRAQSGDYNNLLATIMAACENPFGGEDDGDE